MIPDKGDYTNWRQNRLPAIRIKDHNDLPNFILMRRYSTQILSRKKHVTGDVSLYEISVRRIRPGDKDVGDNVMLAIL